MNALIARGLRPFQCAHALVGGGFLSSPSGAIFGGAAERLTRAAFLLAGRLHSRGISLPTRPTPLASDDEDTPVDAPRISHVEPVQSPFRQPAKDIVDEASWESFPASNPPGY